MCKMPDLKIGIESMNFNLRGKFSVKFSDGREILVPVRLFPDIQRLTKKDRNGWMILDDQYFTFQKLSRIYSIADLLDYKISSETIKAAETDGSDAYGM